MIRGYYTAASVARASQDRMNALSNNIANANTVGYKQDRGLVRGFHEQLVSRLSPDSDPESGDALGQLATGSGASVPTIDFAPGALASTGRGLDVALEGPGFLVVQTPDGERLTRAGSLMVDAEGRLTQPDGALVLGESGPIAVGGPDALPVEVYVASDGSVIADGQAVGRLRLVECPAESLRKVGASYFEVTDAAGVREATETSLLSGALEEANVDLTQTAVEMMGVMRTYGMVRELIRIQDEVLGQTVGEVGRVG